MSYIEYLTDQRQMNDLLTDEGIDFDKDFTEKERMELVNILSKYMLHGNDVPTVIELHDLRLKIDALAANTLINIIKP
ncbi:MAG: hypothetical protein K6E18_04985 [Lachnospiraceae bacterium]|nr:hypothetical protein [Lachnospiraceae bacterium]